MGILRPNRTRVVAGLIIFVLVGALGLFFGSTGAPIADALRRESYDYLSRLSSQPSLDGSGVAIVYLDLQSYLHERRDPSQLWPRDIHARLVQRLSAAGARAIVFDVVFGGPGTDSAADEAFAKAIHESGRVVLAGEINGDISHVTGDSEEGARLLKLSPPYEPFQRVCAAWGIAAQRIDDDFVIRHYLAGFPHEGTTLAWAVGSWLHLQVTTNFNVDTANDFWIRYYGPQLTIPHVGYSEALDPGGVPNDFFRDKIIFIGARPSVEMFHERKDQFRSPYHSWLNKDLFMPGVEVHATEMLNLIRGDWLRRTGAGIESLIFICCAALFGAGLVWLRPVPAAAMAALGVCAALGLALFGFAHGTWFPWLIVSAVQIPTALGGSVLFYSVDWYRTRRLMEAAKRIADAKIREQAALIEKAHDAILVHGLDGRILYANAAAQRLYGWTLSELNKDGRKAELFSADPAASASARAAALKDGEWNGELRLQTKSGGIVLVDSRWTLIRGAGGEPDSLLLINSDITEKKELEAQFLRTQRMNTIGTLAGGMAHDLNNALSPILMGVQLLRRKATDDESKNLLGLMETNTYRGADMVRQVLLFARGHGGEMERLEPGPIVRELEKMVRETFPKSIVIEVFLPPDLWHVRGNSTQLHQVLLNLCVNARDAMPQGGRLSFAADNVTLAESECDSIPDSRPGEYVSLIVSDTGTGMPAEVRAKMFEPFFTTKGDGRGTGIGLSTVLRIVKSHGGFLRVESESGQGTTFEVFLPRSKEIPASPVAETPTEAPRGMGELILIADDERAIAQLMAEGLRTHGYQVLTAESVREALSTCAQHAGEVKLFITDTMSAPGSASDPLIEIRKMAPRTPVILATGQATTESSTVGGVSFLRKPFSLEELLTMVGHCLSKK